MNHTTELQSYALDFVSYLLGNVEGKIQRIILFGSIARGDFDTESDIDLFVDTKDKGVEKKILKLIDSYHITEKAKRWKLKGIGNQFSCVVGELDSLEWKDLKRSIINNGIIVYGKYKAEADKVYQYTIFSFENVTPESRRVGLYRALFGFNAGKQKYPGLAGRLHLLKLGKGCVLSPAEHVAELKEFFRKKKVTVKLYDVWGDTKLA